MQKQGQLIVCCICLCKDTNFKANHNPRAKKVSLPCCCICLCKDTNFKANHNTHNPVKYTGKVVYAYAKILILKQITTMQKQGQLIVCCICLCKDTNFKANHNIARWVYKHEFVVYAYAKILILKQITTIYWWCW